MAIGFVLVPILFNVFFGILAKNFEYPDILRHPTGEVLKKFSSGGSSLILTWWAFMLTAVAFVPIATAIPSIVNSTNQTLNTLVVVTGLTAGLVQFIGLSRWVFLVPFLARESSRADEQRKIAIDIVFQSANRFLGVAIGEHLGYLFTGLWSISASCLFIKIDQPNYPLGITGILAGVLLLICSMEFVGKNEKDGWAVAAKMTPFVYIAWSLWLVWIGIQLLILS